MGLADAIAADMEVAVNGTRTNRCSINQVLTHVSEKERVALIAYLADARIDGTHVTKFLNEQGAEMLADAQKSSASTRGELEYVGHILSRLRPDSIRRHRRGACSCTPEVSQ